MHFVYYHLHCAIIIVLLHWGCKVRPL